jgi:DNA-binding transcriptional LysR family regulator
MPSLRLSHLRTLRAVARTGSFSRAGEALRLSQPAVSVHIAELEAGFGASLLERVGKRAFATPAGEAVLRRAQRIFDELDGAVQDVAALRGLVAGRVRLGTSATATIYLLPPILRRLRRRHPAIELSVVTGNAPDMIAGVLANEFDLALATLPAVGRELLVTKFYTDDLVAIAPPEKPWLGRRSVTPAELARHPLVLFERGGHIRRVMDSWFARAGAAPANVMEVGNSEATKTLVGAGLGVSLISAIAVRAEAKSGALAVMRLTPPLHRELGLIRRRDKPASPAFDAVLAAFAKTPATR